MQKKKKKRIRNAVYISKRKEVIIVGIQFQDFVWKEVLIYCDLCVELCRYIDFWNIFPI